MAQREADLLTQARYAEHRKVAGLPGGSREAVRKAVDEGRISTIGGKINPELADIEWARNTRARLSPQAAGATPAVAPANAVATVPAQPPAAPSPAGDLVDQAQALGSGAGVPPAATPAPAANGYTLARARREEAEAEQAEIDLQKSKGELVSWADVSRGGFELGRDVRDTMAAAVNQLSAELANAGSAEACAEILRRHNRAVCDVLVRSWRERIGPLPVGGLAA